MQLDLERVRKNVRQASSEDLLDRVTVYRAGMEPEALPIIEEELTRRGFDEWDIELHAIDRGREVIPLEDGTALRCSFCDRPAVLQAWGWHRLWGRLPVFPRFFSYCGVHRRDGQAVAAQDAPAGNELGHAEND
jgi:hypothetical protein